MTSGRRCATAAVRTGDNLQKMAVRVVEVESAPAVPGVDLVALAAAWVGPVCQAPFTNPLEDLVEFVLVHQERIVLRRDLAIGVDIVQRRVVAYRTTANGPTSNGAGRPRISLKNFAAVSLSCAATIV